MIRELFGKKIGMTRIFRENGKVIPVSVLEIAKCYVTQIKRVENEGYNALQIGFQPKKEKRINKPMTGHFKKAGKGGFSFLREIKVDDIDSFEVGQEIGSDIFDVGDLINARGITKGMGFAGVVKRWGFSGGNKTHGSRSHNVPGSIGACATPSRVMKGKKLPGRMGNEFKTVKNLEVVDILKERDLILIKGGVPGSKGNFLELKLNKKKS